MFDRILANLSLRRSLAGIYFELRTLRQILAQHWEIDVASLRERPQRVPLTDEDASEDGVTMELTEEQLAAIESDRVRIAILEGRDPGTSWRPDPNR